MNQKLSKLRPLVLVMVLLLLVNCSEDLYEAPPAQEQTQSQYIQYTGEAARKLKLKAMLNLNKDGGKKMQDLKNIANRNLAGRTIEQIVPYIDDTEIIGITNPNGSINYTFRLRMPDASLEKFHNLVMTEINDDVHLRLFTYEMDKDFAVGYHEGGDLLPYTGTVNVETIGVAKFPCDEDPQQPAPVQGGIGGGNVGTGPGSGGGSGSGGGGGGRPRTIIYPVTTNPILIAAKLFSLQFKRIGGNTKEVTIESGPLEPGFEGTIVLPGPANNTDFRFALDIPGIEGVVGPCGDSEDIIILEPVDPEKTHEKHCDELKKFIQNAANLASMKDVENTASDNDEDGYSYSDNNPPVQLEGIPGNQDSMKVPSGGTIYGASHNHANPATSDAIPMFSITDIAALGLITARYQGSPKNYNKFILTLSIDQGGGKQTFAIKIDNWLHFAPFVTEFYNNPDSRNTHKKELGKLFNKVNKINGTTGYLKVLLKYMEFKNIKGIGIYKADNNQFTSWSRLDYDKINNDIIIKPCN